MKLLVGLGNPGAQYAFNRHNVGFMAVDAIAAAHGFPAWRKRFQGLACEGKLGREACLLLKPGTFMNESGRAVGEAVRFYKLELHDVIVFHDELDLAPGKLRVKTGGGSAGHNGLKSITAHIGNDYARVRIGIGHPGSKELVQPHVMHDFAKSDQEWLEAMLGAIAEEVPSLAEGANDKFQSSVAYQMQREERGANEPPVTGTPRERPNRDAPRSAATKPADAPQGTLAGKLRKWLGAGTD